MKTNKSLQFHEVMNGVIALRVTDPTEAYSCNDAYAASLRATIDIEDVGEFIRARRHVGRLRAELVIPVLGGRYLSGDGKFILFEPGHGPGGRGLREMVYDADLVNDDRVYRMHAHKILKPGRPWRLWPETTTLLVTLEDVTTQPAEMLTLSNVLPTQDRRPPRAAGVLRLSAGAFSKQVLNMHVYGERVKWFHKPFVFGRYALFFVVGLVKIYVLRSLPD